MGMRLSRKELLDYELNQVQEPVELTDKQVAEKLRNRRNVKKGKQGETLVKNTLEQLGLHMVEKVEVGWGVKRDQRGRPVQVWPLAKVSGDFRAITSKGQSVLIEVKTYDEERLPHSALEKHQVTSLNEHENLGGISLFVWVRYGEVLPMWWPIEGFVKGKSLSYEAAKANLWKGEV
jgi:hypothetical protein